MDQGKVDFLEGFVAGASATILLGILAHAVYAL